MPPKSIDQKQSFATPSFNDIKWVSVHKDVTWVDELDLAKDKTVLKFEAGHETASHFFGRREITPREPIELLKHSGLGQESDAAQAVHRGNPREGEVSQANHRGRRMVDIVHEVLEAMSTGGRTDSTDSSDGFTDLLPRIRLPTHEAERLGKFFHREGDLDVTWRALKSISNSCDFFQTMFRPGEGEISQVRTYQQ